MHQIKDQDIQGHQTRTYLHYLNVRKDNTEKLIKDIYHHQSHALKINLSFYFILQHRETLENILTFMQAIMNNYEVSTSHS